MTEQPKLPETVPNVEREIITALMVIRDRRNRLNGNADMWNGDKQTEREELDQRLGQLMAQKNQLKNS